VAILISRPNVMNKIPIRRFNVNAPKKDLINVDNVSNSSVDDLLNALNNKFSDSLGKKNT